MLETLAGPRPLFDQSNKVMLSGTTVQYSLQKERARERRVRCAGRCFGCVEYALDG